MVLHITYVVDVEQAEEELRHDTLIGSSAVLGSGGTENPGPVSANGPDYSVYLSSLPIFCRFFYVQFRKCYFNGVHANSIPFVTYLFPFLLILLVIFDVSSHQWVVEYIDSDLIVFQ